MKRKTIVPFIDFRGGINDTSSPDNMQDNELVEGENIELSTRGGFTYRPGTMNINSASYEGNVTQLIEFPLEDGAIRKLSIINKVLYDTTDGTKKQLTTLARDKVGFFIFRNRFYFVDGEKYRVYGDFDYYTNSGTITIKTGDIVKNEPISTGASPGIEGKFYRAKSDLGSVNLSTASYGDTSKWEDVSLGSIPDAVRDVKAKTDTTNDLKPIMKCTNFVLHPDSYRVFAFGNPKDQSSIYYSEPGEPNFFKELNKIVPTMGDGPVKALTLLSKSVLVGFKYSWWEYKGIDPTVDATWNPLPVPNGVVSSDTIALTPTSITYLSTDGIYTMHMGILNQDIVMISSNELVRSITDAKVEKIIASIKNPEKTCAIFRDNKYFLAFNDKENVSTNNKILVYDWKLNSFVIYTGLEVNCMLKQLDHSMLLGSRNFTLKMNESYYNDVDSNGNLKPIHLKVSTKRFSFGSPINQKLIHRFFLTSSQDVDIGNTLNVRLKIDYSMSNFYDVNLNNESLIWGEAWGKVWGVADIASQEAKIRKKGVRTQVIFEANQINTRNTLVIYGIAFEIETLRARAKRIDEGRSLV